MQKILFRIFSISLVVLLVGSTVFAQDRVGTPPDDAGIASFGIMALSSPEDLATAMGIPSEIVNSTSILGSDSNGIDVFYTAGAGFPTEGDSYAVLSTGATSSVFQPNNSGSTTTYLGGSDTSQGTDMVQFEVNIDTQGASSWAVDFKFFSEEFPEWVGTQFNDTFLIELGDSNFSLVGDTVVAPNNQAFDTLGQLVSVNEASFNEANAFGTTYDGATTLLSTGGDIPPGVDNITLTFTVMDLGDSAWDSTAFFDNFRLEYHFASPEIDIKPGSDPSCTNNNGNGVIPVAIFGSVDFDVTTIVPESLLLQDVMPVRAVGKKGKLQFSYQDWNYDGFMDMVVQFEDIDGVFGYGTYDATVTGELDNGMELISTSDICITQGDD